MAEPDIDNLRWEKLQRYKIIEIVALWEGRLTTNVLMNLFGIARQQASIDLNSYLSQYAPANLVYDRFIKAYVPGERFKPVFTQGIADEYLFYLLNFKNDPTHFITLDRNVDNIALLRTAERHISADVIRSLVQAARLRHFIEANYCSFNRPQGERRRIAPHTLVYNGHRWHCRAFCEDHGDFRNFLLTRFRGELKIIDRQGPDVSQDTLWNKKVTVRVIPHPGLSEEQKKIVENDYGMRQGVSLVRTNGALVQFVLDLLNIAPHRLADNPQVQQIIVQNMEELTDYLWV